MAAFFTKNRKIILYLVPTALVALLFFLQALSYSIHDFGNSYFPALLLHEGRVPEDVIFDIYSFNQYAWNLGYTDVLLDFYFNSPFNVTVFYPLVFFEDAYTAKAVFNGLSILLFMYGVFLLLRMYKPRIDWKLLLIPVIFLTPLKNGILFGQSYLLVFFLVVFGYYQIERSRHVGGTLALGFAALLKFFPVFYGIPFLFQRNWKAIGIGILVTLGLIAAAIGLSGVSLWKFFFLEVLPNGMKNGSVMDYRLNSQSFDVFLKTLFVQDPYYNPEGWWEFSRGYRIAIWVIKGVVLGTLIHLSFLKRKTLFTLLCLWVTGLFLLQSKTASYAQILWLIPAMYMLASRASLRVKCLFFGLLFVVCNLPVARLISLPLFLKFTRLWLSIALLVLVFRTVFKTVPASFAPKYILIALLILLPFNTKVFLDEEKDGSDYVLNKKTHFMVYDYKMDNGSLQYSALGRNGDEMIATDIPINSFEPERCELRDNQIFLDGKQITFNSELKKKPVLVNSCEIYYLGDRLSRRGAYTLKKINTCGSEE